MKKDYGTTLFEGKEYTLTQDAYYAEGRGQYTAHAVDEDGNEYMIYWNIVAEANEDGYYECEEDEMCDWDEADEIEKL